MFSIGKIQFTISDIIILCASIIFTVWLYNVFWFGSFWLSNGQTGEAETLVVQYADKSPVEYPLEEERLITIEGAIGDSIIEIKQGKARFIHSSCRNQFCVFHGWLTIAGDTTACLPNRISISLKGQLTDYDAIAGGQ